MALYDIDGNVVRAYDIDGNVISGDGEPSSVGYVTDPEYIEVEGNPYRLVWHDEFEDKDIDKNFWTDVQFINTKEKRYQSWTDYYLSDSKLHLRIKKDAPDCFIDNPDNNVAQSIIQTGQKNQLHVVSPSYHDVNPFWGLIAQEGYYEHRFKMFKATGGCHVGLWTVGVQYGDKSATPLAEIDITEILASATTNLPHGLHQNGDSASTELYRAVASPVNFANDFHTLGFLWENGVMKWYVDGTLVDTFENINTPQYPMIFFFAAYKRISGTGWTGDADTTLDDVEYQVDYFRIYKKATSQATDEVTISGYTPINVDATTANMTIDDDYGCPKAMPPYVYVNWSDGSRTEHWVKWQAVKDTYRTKMTNQQSFTWDGYVYGLGINVVANINY